MCRVKRRWTQEHVARILLARQVALGQRRTLIRQMLFLRNQGYVALPALRAKRCRALISGLSAADNHHPLHRCLSAFIGALYFCVGGVCTTSPSNFSVTL